MKIIFFGLGSIGRRHARLLRRKFNHKLFAYRTNKEKTNALNIQELYSWVDVEKTSGDVAFITNPTYLHIKTAIRCAKLGMHLFIEKPIDCTHRKLDELINIVRKKRLTTYVAYCMRFNPIIKRLYRELKKRKKTHVRVVASSYLPDWRPQRDYSNTYSASKRKGGGVILDLSHEIDYIRYLFGNILKAQGASARVSSLKITSCDYADFIIKCQKAVVNLHLNFFSKNIERTIAIDFKNSDFIKADLINNTLLINKNNRKRIYKYSLKRDDIYSSQLDYFFRNFTNKKMMNNLPEASKLFSKIIALEKLK